MSTSIKMANRYGLNLKLTNIADENDTMVIDFANEVSLEISGEITWATGGQGHVKMIGFKDPLEGTLKVSTQVTDNGIMNLVSGQKLADESGVASFNGKMKKFRYYKIDGDTVWQDEDGNIYTEHVIAYKALVKPNYNITYNGSGDPVSIDIEFQLAEDKEQNFVDIKRDKDPVSEDNTEGAGSETPNPDTNPDGGDKDPGTDSGGGDTGSEGDGTEGEGTENP